MGMLVALGAAVLVVVVLYVRERLTSSKLSKEVRMANDRIRMTMEAGDVVGWDWDLQTGRNVRFGNLRTNYAASGEPVRMTGIAADATDRMESEKTRSLLAAVVASCDESIVAAGLDGTIAAWNLGAHRIFGYTGAEAIGKPVTLLVPPELLGEEAQIIERIKAGERLERYETIRATKDE